ncbi:hypothetical protein [Leptolyngbya ohadii]|uniref:hypothetical protein n=1 Tax=Leptolyngbya ohadii TaxID=1962290 RepID=UPI00117BB2A3|nr:hypothetical protein [Leptolyngbya ohadii]
MQLPASWESISANSRADCWLVLRCSKAKGSNAKVSSVSAAFKPSFFRDPSPASEPARRIFFWLFSGSKADGSKANDIEANNIEADGDCDESGDIDHFCSYLG